MYQNTSLEALEKGQGTQNSPMASLTTILIIRIWYDDIEGFPTGISDKHCESTEFTESYSRKKK